jgi:hypothetical protein
LTTGTARSVLRSAVSCRRTGGSDSHPASAEDDEYVEQKYREVHDSIQRGMDALALPLFG